MVLLEILIRNSIVSSEDRNWNTYKLTISMLKERKESLDNLLMRLAKIIKTITQKK